MTHTVDEYINSLPKWSTEIQLLRSILNETELIETIKWNAPCYIYKTANVCMIGSFSNFCAISFFKGSLLSSHSDLLQKPGQNSNAVRLLKFTSLEEIKSNKVVIKECIQEALKIERKGLKIEKVVLNSSDFPKELLERFKRDTEFKSKFMALSKGRQRGYLIYFSGAKQSKTIENRINKYFNAILKGYGIHDCTCGLSKKMPTCDGSHKDKNNQ